MLVEKFRNEILYLFFCAFVTITKRLKLCPIAVAHILWVWARVCLCV